MAVSALYFGERAFTARDIYDNILQRWVEVKREIDQADLARHYYQMKLSKGVEDGKQREAFEAKVVLFLARRARLQTQHQFVSQQLHAIMRDWSMPGPTHRFLDENLNLKNGNVQTFCQ